MIQNVQGLSSITQTDSHFLYSIVIGSISGVFAAGLIWILKYLFSEHFLPFYQATVYQGSSIDGSWAAFDPKSSDAQRPFASIIVKQSAHRVTATYVMHLTTGEGDLSFDCQGEYWEGYLSIRGRSHLRSNYSILTALLKLRDSGAGLQGDVCFRHRAEDKPVTLQEIYFTRKTLNPS